MSTTPAAGTLTFNGVPVTANTVISVANIGQLQFTPAFGGSGVPPILNSTAICFGRVSLVMMASAASAACVGSWPRTCSAA